MGRRWLLAALLFVCVSISPLSAADSTGTITGTVIDPREAVVPKARIRVRNEETNLIRDVQTNDDGDYTVALLPPGRYQVTVEMRGFQKGVTSGVILNVDHTVRVDFSLVIGVSTEEVQVTATPPIVQTDTSALGQVINGRQLHELPLNERRFLNFALLVPGAQAPAEGSENSGVENQLRIAR